MWNTTNSASGGPQLVVFHMILFHGNRAGGHKVCFFRFRCLHTQVGSDVIMCSIVLHNMHVSDIGWLFTRSLL